MKFCSHCGNPVSRRLTEGDDRLRFVCSSCNTIHYQNPKIVVGIIPTLGNRILLCRRAIAPRSGYWTLPAGYLECGETTFDGARRETWEEARASVINEEMYRIIDLPHIDEVQIFYRADLVDENFGPGRESLEVQLFSKDEIPWNDIAFPVVHDLLTEFINDSRVSQFPVRVSKGVDSSHLFCVE